MTRTPNLPVPVGPARDARDARRERAGAQTRVQSGRARAGVFDAQLYGQDGVVRGLKGGAPVLDAARAAYLDAEWSDADRRLPAGIFRITKV